jgi:spore coat polysaccharide biosynthesis protein SpsF
MNSSRLPGKVLVDIAGTPMLQRIIERTAAARSVDEVVVATTIGPDDDVLVDQLHRAGVGSVYRGSVDDVLDRFARCATLHRADIVVRVTADDPLKDPGLIDRAVAILMTDPSMDYCSNTIIPSFPEGLDIEVVRFAALSRANAEAFLKSDREHVTPYIWRHPKRFGVHNFSADRDLSSWRWTVDEPADVEFMRAIFARFGDDPLVPYQQVVAWIDANPDLRLINEGQARNAGYLKSLQADRS